MSRVLIIDDEDAHNFLNLTLLKLMGITDVEAMISGVEGLQYLEKCHKNNTFPDIIFLDLNMTGMNGFNFMERYENKFSEYNSRIIVLTNSVLDMEREKALKYKSVLDFWSKPLTKNKLLHLFEKI